MKLVNLREYYPAYYTQDAFVEVSDEVAAFLKEEKRLQTNYAQYIRDHKAYFSLDYGNGIERWALHKPEQPDEALERRELEHLLRAAMDTLTETQRRRIYMNVIDGITKVAIAKTEGVDEATIRTTISRGIKALKEKVKKLL